MGTKSIGSLLLGGVAAALTAWGVPARAQDAPPPTAVPVGNPASWIPADGYPAGAKASAEQGRVGFTLSVDETGRASDCKIVSTSESPLLDETTCNFMIANARFQPARDKRGRAVPSRWSSSVRWKLADPVPPPVAATVPSPPAAPAPAPRR